MTEPRRRPRVLGEPLIILDRTDSTMLDIQRRRDGQPEGLTVVARIQTAGRGRADHVWESPEAGALLCSVLLRPHCSGEAFSLFSLTVGVALAEAIESVSGHKIALKWPNDLLLDGGKVGGILVTTTVSADQVVEAILGFGINSGSPPPGVAGCSRFRIAGLHLFMIRDA